MIVCKFGGTSVGSPQRMRQVMNLINDDQPKIVVLSAMAGTTNHLLEIAAAYRDLNPTQAHQLIEKLAQQYHSITAELYQQPARQEAATRFVNAKINWLKNEQPAVFTDADEKAMVAQGELMSTQLFHWLLLENGIDNELLPALQFMRTRQGEPDLKIIRASLQPLIRNSQAPLFITQGFICKNEHGGIDNLKRGGSDYSASIIGAAIDAAEIQIWTDIDGMHNNDPRVVKDTSPIHELSFDEAAELAYFGAKILHPASVLPAKQANIPVRLLNTLAPDARGTLISATDHLSAGQAKAVAAKDGITAIRIRSSRMLLAYGFLKKVFEIFEQHQTSIDMITTSEVAVSLTIDDDSQLPSIQTELEKLGEVEIDHGQTIICVVGNFDHARAGVALEVLQPLKDIPIRMIASGGSRRNISVLVDAHYKIEALQALNVGLFARVNSLS